MKLIGQVCILLFLGTTSVFSQKEIIDRLKIKIEKKQSSYGAGQPIVVKLTITNPTDSIQTIEFTESHKYHKTLPYPTCISATLLNEKSQNHCNYSSQYFIWSTLFTKDDFQYLNIRPGEFITRDLKVNEIVSGCDCFQDNGLRPGTYLVMLSVHGRPTNELKIEVK